MCGFVFIYFAKIKFISRKFMNKIFIYMVFFSTAFLSACGSKTDANEKNFGSAIETDLKKTEICLPFDKWPYRVLADDKPRMGKMSELESLGFLSGADFEVDKLNFWNKPSGQKIKLRIFSLTDQGKKVFLETSPPSADGISKGYLCYGQVTLDKVIKWEVVPNQMMLVTYIYKMKGIAEWVKNPALLTVFPDMAKFIKEIDGGKENQVFLKLTNLGWETVNIGIEFGKVIAAGKIIQTYDITSVNQADYLPVASQIIVTPVAAVVATAVPKIETIQSEKVNVPAPVVAVKLQQLQKMLPNGAKPSSEVQIRQINLND